MIGTYRSSKHEADTLTKESQAAGGSAVMLHLDIGITADFAAFADSVGTALNETFGREHLDAAIEVLTRYQAKELGHRGIRVNVVAPGTVATDFDGGVIRDNPDANRAVADTITLGRVGLTDDIGAALTAVLSDGFAWANGSRIELSGGQNL